MFFRRPAPPPPMTLEGVLGPNTRLDDAQGRDLPGAAALAVVDEGLLVAAHTAVWLLRSWQAAPLLWAELPAPIAALAAGPEGLVAAMMRDGGLAVLDGRGRVVPRWPVQTGARTATDAAFLSATELAVADCGLDDAATMLAQAPWDEVPRGRILSVGPDAPAKVLADALHCPAGLCLGPEGLAVTLCERAAIVDPAGAPLRAGLPGYLGRLRRTPTGYLLACLARRDPLIEFLRGEPAFVAQMKATIATAHWIAPRSSPAFRHDLPIEMGATRLFGEVKPWAPSFSYGLVIELDADLMPVASAHSRANGRRHAIADAAFWDGGIVAISAGSGEILRLESMA